MWAYKSLPYPETIDGTNDSDDSTYYDDNEHDETDSCLESRAVKKLLSLLEESSALVQNMYNNITGQGKREQEILKKRKADVPEVMRVSTQSSKPGYIIANALSESISSQDSLESFP